MKNQGYKNIEKQQEKGAFNIRYERIKCKKSNKAQSICQNRNCLKDPLICANKLCECNLQHKRCLIIILQNFIQSILSKVISLKPIQQSICSPIQKIINQLSDFKDEMIIKLKQNFQYVGLADQQITILEALKNDHFNRIQGDASNITGKMIWYVSFNFQQTDETNQKVKQLSKLIDQIWEPLNKEIISTTKLILSSFQDFRMNTIDSSAIQQLFTNSKIIKTKQQSINLIKYFTFGKVENAKLLYRASQDQFNAGIFHLKCDNIPDTLCIVQTQYGKVLGGYTPLSWCASQNIEYLNDQSGKSFLFSLTYNKKFQLVSKEYAICRNNKYGPIFGKGCNFCINNQSNIGGPNNSQFYINTTYYRNLNYPQGSKQVYQKLIGNPSYSFKVKQWQLWSLQFKIE